ncbi:MAG: hypothetical protein IT423_17800, partial [Pirellulaceae bacterium]|nr:hypothetical protein [Pirellulaceae bacterium]
MNSRPERPKNWRGEREVVFEPPRYRWQTGFSKQSVDLLQTSNRFAGWRLASFLVVTCAMLTAWVVVLLHAPVKTPLIAVAATAYNWPLPPNAWASEDMRGLSTLNGQTLHWHDSSAAWQSKSMALEDLQDRLREMSGLARRSRSLILYLNMVGMVNQEGRPCLIPPNANALEPAQWLTLDEITAVLSSILPADVQVLLVLDCVDERVNWSAAMLHSTFAESLQAWITDHPMKNLAIIESTSPEEQAWSGPELQGSIFGREFRLGLAGLADL